jgi:PAS domain S-box-containing protein
MNQDAAARLPRYRRIIAVFVAMTMLQAAVAAFSIQLLSSVRAYVTGESLYSKGQKDAQIYLLDYAEKQREADYVRFMSALAMPLGDRVAREALQQPEPDIAKARQGFLDAGNHPDDIDGLIRTFRWFQHVPFMSKPIATWTEGDRVIEQMRGLVDRARARIRVGEPQAEAVREMRVQAPVLNERLTRLESMFSFQLGEASRTTQHTLLVLNASIALLITLSGLWFVRRTARVQASTEAEVASRQAALRRGELRMERLIDAVTDGVVTVDADQKIVLFNRAAEAMFGVRATEALGVHIDRFIANPADRDAATASSVLALSGQLHELVGTRQDGQAFPVEASLSRLDTERGVLTTVVLRDASALHAANAERRARQALEASNQAKTEFLSRMSHELRTPLNAVIGFAQLLRMDASQPLSIEQLERVQHVESAGEHLLALVNDVLDLSRIESGDMAVAQDAIPMSAVVEEATTMVSPLVTDAGVEIFVASMPSGASRVRPDLFPDPLLRFQEEVWVQADRVRLRQVLVNLLSNAIKYNRPGGSVALSWKVADGVCEVSVVDTGQGIAPDKIAGLFEPFNRLGAEASRVDGTGIGLVLSRQLAEMMGGSLHITSTFGEGTTARLALRITAPPAANAASSAPQNADARPAQAMSVLYAEDNEVNAELMRQIVSMRPAVSLRMAENGSIALEMATLDPPDLMLVDMNLGDMTGIELAHLLHRNRATRDIRLVALSADAMPAQIDAAMRCGFESYLTKPINFRELLAVLDKHSQDA